MHSLAGSWPAVTQNASATTLLREEYVWTGLWNGTSSELPEMTTSNENIIKSYYAKTKVDGIVGPAMP
eukprot:scaffold33044_cov36-Prasinocladus_malaysianus.AAC.2